MTECTPGMYCATAGLSEPTGNCTAGYYCSGLATSPTPSDSTGIKIFIFVLTVTVYVSQSGIYQTV